MPNPNSLSSIWEKAVDRFSERLVLRLPSGKWSSYSEVDAVASRLTIELQRSNVGPGDFVLLNLGSKSSYLPAFLAVWRCGAVAVPAPSDIGQERRRSLAILCSFCLTDDGMGTGYPSMLCGKLSGAERVRVTPSAAYAMMTSGTTGTPKTCVISHETASIVQRGIAGSIGPIDEECFLHTASFSFSSSIRQLFQPIMSGSRIVFVGGRDGLDWSDIGPRSCLDEVTSVDLTPSQIKRIIATAKLNGYSNVFPALRRVLVASERLNAQDIVQWRNNTNQAHTIYHLYGKTETGGAISVRALSAEDEKRDVIPLSAPYPPLAMKLLKDVNGYQELLVGDLGNGNLIITIGSDGKSIIVQQDPDGWHKTGDLFTQSADKGLLLSGRKDRTVKILGVAVDLDAVEASLEAKFPTCTFLVTQAERAGGGSLIRVGYSVSAPNNEVISQHLIAHAIEAMCTGLPVQVIALGNVPLNSSGKLDRLSFAETSPGDSFNDALTTLWRAYTSPDEGYPLDLDRDFFSAGGDSLSLVSLLVALKKETGLSLSISDFLARPTLRSLLELTPVDLQDVVSKIHEPSAPTSSPIPASGLQEGICISEQLTPSTSDYWLSVECVVDRLIDVSVVQEALWRIVNSFQIFRSSFEFADDGSLHWVADRLTASEFVVDATNAFPTLLPSSPMMERSPLLKVNAQTISSSTAIKISIHHAICDRKSLEVLAVLLFAVIDGSPIDMNKYHSAPMDLYSGLRRRDEKFVEEARAYWTQALGAPPSHRSIRPSSPNVRRFSSKISCHANTALFGASRHSWWLAAFACALSVQKLPHHDLIGIDMDIRPDTKGSFVFGPFISSVPIRIPRPVPPTTLPQSINKAVLGAAHYATLSPQDLRLQSLCPTGVFSQPFFLYKMVYQNAAFPTISLDGKVVRHSSYLEGIASNDVTLFVRETNDSADVGIAYLSDVIEGRIAREILEATLCNVTQILSSPDEGSPACR